MKFLRSPIAGVKITRIHKPEQDGTQKATYYVYDKRDRLVSHHEHVFMTEHTETDMQVILLNKTIEKYQATRNVKMLENQRKKIFEVKNSNANTLEISNMFKQMKQSSTRIRYSR